MSDPEPDFEEDVTRNEEAINDALEALSRVKAYALTAEELKSFKAAHYGLRACSREFDQMQARKKLSRVLDDE